MPGSRPIYEGTNGIQAADLVTRKLGYEAGGVLTSLLADAARDCAEARIKALAERLRRHGAVDGQRCQP
jgi:hypothetical protein